MRIVPDIEWKLGLVHQGPPPFAPQNDQILDLLGKPYCLVARNHMLVHVSVACARHVWNVSAWPGMVGICWNGRTSRNTSKTALDFKLKSTPPYYTSVVVARHRVSVRLEFHLHETTNSQGIDFKYNVRECLRSCI